MKRLIIILAAGLLISSCAPAAYSQQDETPVNQERQSVLVEYLGGGVWRTIDNNAGYICYSENDGGIYCDKLASDE